MNIIFKNLDGSVAVVYPTQEALLQLTLDEIAQRIIPNAVAYWIVDSSAISSDRTFREAWAVEAEEKRQVVRDRHAALQIEIDSSASVDDLKAIIDTL